jgi:hypothetical protein
VALRASDRAIDAASMAAAKAARRKKKSPLRGGLNPCLWSHGGDKISIETQLMQRNIYAVIESLIIVRLLSL